MAVCFIAQGPTIDEILLRYGLKAEDLDKQCPLEVRNEVAVKIADWEMVGHCFNFPSEKIRDIKSDNENQERCKIALLDTWNKREGKGATYLKLADVFHRRERRDLVEFLCEKVKSSMRLVPLSGVPDTSWDVSTAVKSQPVSITEDTVLSRIETLEEQFHDIHSRLVTELSTNEGISVDQILQALTMLPFAIRRQYQDTIQIMLPDLEAKDCISSLFNLLNPLFTFIDYELLKHLVAKFGSSKLKEEMAVYAEKVQLFKRATTVSDLVECWPGIELPESNYSRLRAKIGGDPGTFTLEELDSFRRKFFSHLKLSDFVSASILVQLERSNSFVAVWHIPTIITPKLIEAISQVDISNIRLVLSQLLQLSVDEKILYDHLEPTSLINESIMESQSVAGSTHVDVPSQHTEDTAYSLLAFTESTHHFHFIYIAAYVRNTALKMLKLLQRKHGPKVWIRRFEFKKGDCDPCLKLVSARNPFVTEIQPEGGMISASSIWRAESQHIDSEDLQDLQHHYQLKITMKHTQFVPYPINFEGSRNDSQLKMQFKASDIYGKFMMINEQTTRHEQWDYPSEQQPSENIQFGYHSTTGERIQITSDRLGAETSYSATSLEFGVMRCKKGDPPEFINYANDCCLWSFQQLNSNLVTPQSMPDYGYIDLSHLCEGDHIGLRISQDGVLEFFINSESQGIAAKNIYTRDSDIYAVVKHHGNCVATRITKAVTQSDDINLQELCLDKLSSWLKNDKEVNQLPLPSRLRDRLKEYFSM